MKMSENWSVFETRGLLFIRAKAWITRELPLNTLLIQTYISYRRPTVYVCNETIKIIIANGVKGTICKRDNSKYKITSQIKLNCVVTESISHTPQMNSNFLRHLNGNEYPASKCWVYNKLNTSG